VTVTEPRETAEARESEWALAEPRPESPRRLAWRRFRRDRVAVASGLFLAFLLFACFPGASLYERAIGHGPDDQFPYAVENLRPAGPFTVTWDTAFVADDDPFAQHHKAPPAGTPKTLLLLGADSSIGRDEFLRVLYGGRNSLEVALGAALVAIMLGIVLGCAAGYFGGLVDAVISRLTDLVMAFPLLLFLVVIGTAVNRGMREWTLDGFLEKGVLQLIVLIGVFTWFYPARLVRTHILSLRHREFVEAAQMIGAREARIMRTHLLPHVLPPLLAYGTLLVATNVMLEVGATFLNAGISLGTPSWGGLLAQTWGSILNPNPNTTAFNQPWLTVIPSAAIFVTVFALNQFGEGLREASDPRSAR
jgi:peptide/nickel transport system permease protein